MSIAIPENLTERVPIDLALVIILTLACILFVLAPRLNETPVLVLLGLLVLFLPGYSLIAALFPRKDDLDCIEQIALRFLGSSIAVVPLLGLGLNYMQYGIRLVPVLLGLSLFTVLLAVVAGVRRVWLPEAERFVVAVEGWGLGLGCGGDGSGGGRGSSGGDGDGSEGRGGGLA